MDLSSILSKGKEVNEERELFWSIVIESNWVQAGVWEIKDGAAELLSEGAPVAWKEEKELIDSTDTALSGAVSDLDNDAPDPEKVVFGVSAMWVEEGSIKPNKLEILKRLCEKLSVQPAGFVVLPEAIAHLTKTEEGSPLSAILIGISEENLEITLFRLGKLAGTQIVARSVSVSDDIMEGLVRFSTEDPLPSRFILYDGKESELEEIKEQVIQTDWQSKEKIKFLHTPKIEIFKPKDKVLATALAGAAEIAGVKSVVRKDTREKEEHLLKTEEVENIVKPQEEVDAQDVGFVIGEDVSKTDMHAQPPSEMKEPPQEVPVVQGEEHPQRKLKFAQKLNLGKISVLKEKLFMFLENFGVGRIKMKGLKKKNRAMFFGIFSIIALVVLFVGWWFLPSSTVTIFVSPKTLQENVDVETGPDVGSLDLGNDKIPGKYVTNTQSGDKTASTTGTKTIGDKAKGTVEIRNGTSSPIHLSAGDLLTSGDLQFEITSSASVSGAINPGNPGKETVDVEAYKIGSEYNLAKDETFKVKDFDRA